MKCDRNNKLDGYALYDHQQRWTVLTFQVCCNLRDYLYSLYAYNVQNKIVESALYNNE